MPDLNQVAADMTRADAARRKALVATKTKDPRTDNPGTEEDSEQFLSVRTLRSQYLDYLTSKIDEIEEQKDARRYYHGAQWTPEQIRILRLRHQPPSTWNRVARKINGIVGLIERLRSDPKAMPRHPKSEQGAEIATQSIRYVLDANQFKALDPECLLQCGIDGIAGVQLILTQGDEGDPDIGMTFVIGDEYFYDAKSYRMGFDDNRFEGISKWMSIDDAISLFPDKKELLHGLIESGSDMTTNADREYKWVITATKSLRLIEHWYRHRGQWCWAFYVSEVLLAQGLSPFFDDKGKRISSFHMFSAAVDHDGDRYGFFRNLKGPQDSLNQGKSKMQHIANSRRLIAEKGAVDDVETTRREWARPDGYVEVNPGKQIKPDDSKPDLQAFAGFTEDAKAELDGFANSNIAAMQGVGVAQLSGRAIELLRQPGMAELGPFILAYRGWKLRLYRAIWNAIQRHWTGERWIRVNNNPGLAQFLQLNGVGLDQFGRSVIINAVGALDVDIILEEGPDVASMMQETYDALKGYPPGTFPPQVLIELSSLPRSDKDRILAMLQPKPNPIAAEAAKQELEGRAIRNAKGAADVRRTHALADQALATADEKRVKAGVSQHGAHVDAAEFARDTLFEATKIQHEINQPQQPIPGAPQSQPEAQP